MGVIRNVSKRTVQILDHLAKLRIELVTDLGECNPTSATINDTCTQDLFQFFD
jgi:hypothetical protein